MVTAAATARTRARRSRAAAGVLAALLVLAGAGAPEPAGATEDLGAVRDEHAAATDRLADAMARLERAEREIQAIERRLRGVSAELERVQAEVADATARYEAAQRDVRAAAEALEAALTHLDAAAAWEDEATARLQHRLAEIYKRGSTVPQEVLLRVVAASDDWHEVAVGLRIYDRSVAEDRDVLTDALAAIAAADAARTDAETARADAHAAEEAAWLELADLRALEAEQEELLAQVREEREARATLVAELEADAEVAALVVRRLAEEVAKLERIAAEREEARRRAEEEARRAAETGEDLPVDMAWVARLPAAGPPWAEAITAAATARGIDPPLMAALVWTESWFNPTAVSSAGAIGLAQLMPTTAAWLGVDPWVPEQNLDGGARYLRMQIDRFGSLELGLAAYNAGPTAVQNAGPGIPNYIETQLYVIKVLERYSHLIG